MIRIKDFGIVLLLLTVFGLNSCKKAVIQSVHKDQELTIDGYYNDWGSAIIYYDKKDFGLGIQNDSEFVYICLVSADQQIIRSVMRQGFEIQIDIPRSKGFMKLEYPIGMVRMNRPPMEQRGARSGVSNTEMGRQRIGNIGKSNNEWQNMKSSDETVYFNNIQTEFRLYGPDKQELRIIPMINTIGIEINASCSRRQFVYELKVPFKIICDYLKADQNKMSTEIDLKFRLPDLEITTHARPMDGYAGGRGTDGPPGGAGGMGISSRGRSMGAPPGRGPEGNNNESTSKFKFDVKVCLTDG
ncbi:MAG: hypothetical protein J7L22_08035 [Candidatus Marinimicrobia bacterium]|nr:hypothetical protein [Candidatus Neomarinimicrobiota bacterium]